MTPAPEGLLLTVNVAGVGQLKAIGSSAVGPAPGEQVRLRLDRRATAVIPTATTDALVR